MTGWQDYINNKGENFVHASGNTVWTPFQNWGSLDPIVRMERIENLLDILFAGGGGGGSFTLTVDPDDSDFFLLTGSGIINDPSDSELMIMSTYVFPEDPSDPDLYLTTGTIGA